MKGGLMIRLLLSLVAIAACGLAIGLFLLFREGARHSPSAAEASVARQLRRLAIPSSTRQAKNPVAASEEVLAEGRAHFADHCALCHGNDGSGDTDIGRSLYPPAPDMRQDTTQSLSDGELWFIIHNGIPLTGMPAWGEEDDTKDLDSWKLVHFIRHLPQVSEDELAEMERMNPKSPEDEEEEEGARKFLGGERATPEHEKPPPHAH
jgi:mono/diheme cytochrome c family protein